MEGAYANLSAELVLAAVELMGRAGRDGLMRVQGRSMIPTLDPGQLIVVDFSPERLRRGDMLVFHQADLVMVHRLLGDARPREGLRRYRTRGDGVLLFDPPVEPDNVVGRVLLFEHGGYWVSARSRGARVYAWLLAWHNLVWAAAGGLLRYPQWYLTKVGIRAPLQSWMWALDRAILACVHRLLFRPLHRKVPKPDSSAG